LFPGEAIAILHSADALPRRKKLLETKAKGECEGYLILSPSRFSPFDMFSFIFVD
jgi:hypothetical protein